MEGAALGNGNYSVRPIMSGDNQQAGSDLARFYAYDRILNDDRFAVAVS